MERYLKKLKISALVVFLCVGLAGCIAGINDDSPSPVSVLGSGLTFNAYRVYEASDGFSVPTGAFAVSLTESLEADVSASFLPEVTKAVNPDVDVNFVMTRAPIGSTSGRLVGSYGKMQVSSNLSMSFDTQQLAYDTLFTDITGIPTPSQFTESEASIQVSSTGRMFVSVLMDSKTPAFYFSDDGLKWEMANILDEEMPWQTRADTCEGSGPALAVGSDGSVYVAWADSRVKTNDVVFAKCTLNSNSEYVCSNQNVLTSDVTPFDGQYLCVKRINVDVYGDNVYVLWSDTREGEFEHTYIAKSSDKGVTFPSSPLKSKRVDVDAVTESVCPKLVVDPDNGHLLISTYHRGPIDLYKSTDGGETFDDPITAGEVRFNGVCPDMYVFPSSDRVIISTVYRSDHDNNTSGFFMSTDEGDTWGAFTEVGGQTASGYYPLVSASGSNVFLTYYDGTDLLLYTNAANGEGAWAGPFDVSTDIPTTSCSGNNAFGANPDVVGMPDGSSKVVWEDCRNGDTSGLDVYIGSCTVAGCETGEDPLVAAEVRMNPYLFPTGTNSSGSNTYGMFTADGRNGTFDIYYFSGVFGSNAGGSGTLVGGSSTLNDLYPRGIKDANGVIHVVWTQSNAAETLADMYYSKSTDNGATWSDALKINGSPVSFQGFELPVSIASSGGNVYVAWMDDSAAVGSYAFKIHYRELVDGTWSGVTELNALSGLTMSAVPALAVTEDGVVYIAFFSIGFSMLGDNPVDFRSPGIYFASKPKGGAFTTPVKIADGYVLNTDNGPQLTWDIYIVIDGDGSLTVAWADAVSVGQVNTFSKAVLNSGISWIRSVDGGTTWGGTASDGGALSGRIVDPPGTGDSAAVRVSQMSVDEYGHVYVLYSYGAGTADLQVPMDIYLAIGSSQ